MSSRDRRLHILLIHQAFVGLEEAGGTRHAEFARYLVKKGHRVTVITSPVSYLTGRARPPQIEAPLPGLTIRRTCAYQGLHRSFVHRLLNFFSFAASSFWAGLWVRKVDLVWGTSPPLFQAASAWLLARLKGAAFLFEIRDLWPAFAVAAGVLQSHTLITASEWLERWLYRRADQLVINSPGFREHVSARGGRNIEVVPNGADAAMFDPAANGAAFRQTQGLEEKFVVLYAGAHGLSNDLGVVLDAAHLLRDRENIAILLVGDGKDKPALMAQAAEMQLPNLVFVDPLPKAGMAQALAAADTCLAILKPLDLYKTVYPNKVFDYMAAGRPVLLAIDGVIRQVVEQAGAGVFVSPGQPEALAAAIRDMSATPVEAKRMGRAGRTFLEKHFDRARIAAQMQAFIERTAASRREPADTL